jgi:peptidoglycan/xylan/chitin deacetylase (PgdA/CDA1 family)
MSASSDSSAWPDPSPRTDPGARRAWRPPPLVRASVAFSLAAAGTVLARPRWWPWALSAVVADHLLLAGAGLVPRSSLLGPNWTRLPPAAGPGSAGTIAITLDDGPDPDITPRVLALLDEHRVRATFFCVGERVARHPALARAIVERGHAIENHSQRHLHRFALLGPRALAEEVGSAQQAILAATGEVARFFRAPAGLRNPFLEPVLSRAGLRLASWTRRGFDTVSGSAARVLGRLTRQLADGDILLLHDGHAARAAAGGAVILEVLPPLLAAIAAAGLTPVTLRAAADRAARGP